MANVNSIVFQVFCEQSTFNKIKNHFKKHGKAYTSLGGIVVTPYVVSKVSRVSAQRTTNPKTKKSLSDLANTVDKFKLIKRGKKNV
jgi:hypothetical protein